MTEQGHILVHANLLKLAVELYDHDRGKQLLEMRSIVETITYWINQLEDQQL